jgi:aldehyde dehydrogenase (NAD+)
MLSFMIAHVLSSELAPHSAQLLNTLPPQYLDNSRFCIVNGAIEAVTALLKRPYGHIMYTGAGSVGSISWLLLPSSSLQ